VEPGGGERTRKRGHVAAVRDDGQQVGAEAGGDERDTRQPDVACDDGHEQQVGGEPEPDRDGVRRVPGERAAGEGGDLDREREVGEPEPPELQMSQCAQAAAERQRNNDADQERERENHYASATESPAGRALPCSSRTRYASAAATTVASNWIPAFVRSSSSAYSMDCATR
jgi:hypothetical protein